MSGHLVWIDRDGVLERDPRFAQTVLQPTKLTQICVGNGAVRIGLDRFEQQFSRTAAVLLIGGAPPEQQTADQHFRDANPSIDRAGVLRQRSLEILLGCLQGLDQAAPSGTLRRYSASPSITRSCGS